MENPMHADDFLSLRDFTPKDLLHLIGLGCRIKASPAAYSSALKGKTLALIFEKPSLRTRVTFDVGIQQLGGFSVYLSPAEINLGKRESVYDVAKNLERMVQGIMVRTFAHRVVEELAAFASIPVINGLTDFSHPCQAMADYMTMLECKGHLGGLKVAYVGDGNNVAHSLIFGAAQLGVHIAIATPPGYEPDQAAVAWAKLRAQQTNGAIEVTNDPVEAVTDADVVYTDVWTSMGQEQEAKVRRAVFLPFQVNAALFARAKSNAIFMHCLPAHRGDEVTDDVIDNPRSVVFQEAENRLHAQKAILLELMQPVSMERLVPEKEAVHA
jgi:ornithine carbamoyltransferase